MLPSKLYHLTKLDTWKANKIATKAYHDDPLFASFFPDESNRNNLKYLFNMGFRHALKHGEVHAPSNNIEGVAAWIRENKAIMSNLDSVRAGLFTYLLKAKGKNLKNLLEYTETCEMLHRKHAPFPHWYLENIAVLPEHQGKGHASFLLKTMLERIDEEKLPCYLETQNKKNVSIYQKFGFKVVEETTIIGQFDFYLMLRKKKGRS